MGKGTGKGKANVMLAGCGACVVCIGLVMTIVGFVFVGGATAIVAVSRGASALPLPRVH